jgi:murein DD-endopeptidase MepM/ murein hydrolase activator NlpD
LEYDIDEENYLHIQKEEGAYRAEIKKIPYDIKVKTIWGIIEDNPISAVKKRDIDFYADLRQGDSFKIIFEKKYLNGEFVGYEDILAAEFVNQGKTFLAFRYTYPDTKESDYFDLEGGSLRKQFLKSPIRYSRITSRFSRRRLHPIRKVFRPHYGVDYAAIIGTPVQVTADGTVTFAGRRGPSGRMITVRHINRYETMYLHLRGYAAGIRKGKKVKGGQEIGYVGSSGESTGPHLDYRIKKDGKYINPLLFNPEPVRPLRKEYQEDYKKKADSYVFVSKPLGSYFHVSEYLCRCR